MKCLENGISDAERNLERERLVSDMYQRRDQEKDVELRTIKQSLVQDSLGSQSLDVIG